MAATGSGRPAKIRPVLGACPRNPHSLAAEEEEEEDNWVWKFWEVVHEEDDDDVQPEADDDDVGRRPRVVEIIGSAVDRRGEGGDHRRRRATRAVDGGEASITLLPLTDDEMSEAQMWIYRFFIRQKEGTWNPAMAATRELRIAVAMPRYGRFSDA
ncbi:hypothetical protein NL676_033063 [Syzygium grande]|nr:hypothetical protein NL676_033063 [Syzygium grande]